MPKPKIMNAMQLETVVQQMGFLTFFACSIPNFSIEEFTPSRYWFVENVDGPWEWRMDVARRGVVAYGKLFSRKAGLVSREWYPDLANYRRNGYDFDARYKEGLASHREKCIMDILLRDDIGGYRAYTYPRCLIFLILTVSKPILRIHFTVSLWSTNGILI